MKDEWDEIIKRNRAYWTVMLPGIDRNYGSYIASKYLNYKKSQPIEFNGKLDKNGLVLAVIAGVFVLGFLFGMVTK